MFHSMKTGARQADSNRIIMFDLGFIQLETIKVNLLIWKDQFDSAHIEKFVVPHLPRQAIYS